MKLGVRSGMYWLVGRPAAQTSTFEPWDARGQGNAMARVLVVDDDPSVADAISRTLRRAGHLTMVVHKGLDAIEAARTQTPDMVVLDIVMPGGMDGVQVCKRLRADPNMTQIPILFLTSRAMIEDKTRGFEAGADDYLTKPFAIQELELRVRALLRRAQLPSAALSEPGAADATSGSRQQQEEAEEESVLAVGELKLNCRTFEVSASSRSVLLTPVEFELLNHLMKYPGQIFSSEQLLQEVWDYPPGTGDPALVRMHIRNLRTKIEPAGADKPAFIHTVVRRGYTIRPV